MLPAEALVESMAWLSALPHPWCRADEALKRMPALDGLAEIETYLKQVRPLSLARQA